MEGFFRNRTRQDTLFTYCNVMSFALSNIFYKVACFTLLIKRFDKIFLYALVQNCITPHFVIDFAAQGGL